MPLTVPSTDLLAAFQHEEAVEDADWAAEALQMATDLLSLATGLEEDPADPTARRIARWGILDMAWYLLASHEDKEAVFSPFSSERIGSYSYQKASNAARAGELTGVSWFDRAAELLGLDTSGGRSWSSSEKVMAQPYGMSDEGLAWELR